MARTSPSLSQQLWRRRPITGAPIAKGATTGLQRSIGAFGLAMFGIGATVGTGIFFVLAEAVPTAGPAVLLSCLLAGVTAGLSALCYAEMASAVPVSGSTYSYAYATLGELAAMVVAACLLLEYGVAISAVAVGWSGYLNKLLSNIIGMQIPQALSAAPWGTDHPGIINLPAILLIFLCALLLIRGTSESALVNSILVLIKLGSLAMFVVIALTAFDGSHFEGFWDKGIGGITSAAGTIFFSYVGLDVICTAGDEVKNPQRVLPIAIILALVVVTGIYMLVVFAGLGSQPAAEFASPEQAESGLAVILEKVTGNTIASTALALGAVISIFSVTLVTLYGQTRILFTLGRDGLAPDLFAKVNVRTMSPLKNTLVVSMLCAILAGVVPLDYLLDMVSIGTLVAFGVVSVGVMVLRKREPDLRRPFKVPFYPVTPILSVLSCVWVISGLHWLTWVGFILWVGVVVAYYLIWGRHHSALNQTSETSNATPPQEVNAQP